MPVSPDQPQRPYGFKKLLMRDIYPIAILTAILLVVWLDNNFTWVLLLLFLIGAHAFGDNIVNPKRDESALSFASTICDSLIANGIAAHLALILRFVSAPSALTDFETVGWQYESSQALATAWALSALLIRIFFIHPRFTDDSIAK